MKTVTEVVVREVTKYVAKDGTVFYDEAGCKKYEKDLARTELKAKLQQIEYNEEADGFCPLDGCEYYEYHDYRWYRPKTREEATVLYEWFELEYELDDTDIGQWICIEISDDESWAYALPYSIIHVKSFLDKFGYDVTITKKEDIK